jgi:hypothetical protein
MTTSVADTTIARGAAQVRSVAELAQLLRELRRREARHRNGTARTYRELAARTGWSHAIIGDYLTGATLAPTDRFDQLIRMLGATSAERAALAAARDRVEELRRPSRSAAAPERASVSENVPRELPGVVAGFVGRSSHLRRLDRLIQTHHGGLVVAAICGAGGVGKTALAIRWAHLAADHFPDGQLYVDLCGYAPTEPVATVDALGRFLHALGVDPSRIPAGIDERATLYRTMLAGRRMLVVLDNAESAEQVRPLMPGSSTCMVVVTSRESLAGLVVTDGAHRIDLDVLSDTESWALMQVLLGDRVHTEREDVHALMQMCAGLPLALRIVAELANRANASIAELVSELRDHRARLDLLDVGDPRSAVRSVVSWSYRRLSPAAAKLFVLLGNAPGPDVSLWTAASLAGVSPDVCRRLLSELARAYMITEAAPARFAVHNVPRAYAVEQCAPGVPVRSNGTPGLPAIRDEGCRTVRPALSPGWSAAASGRRPS